MPWSPISRPRPTWITRCGPPGGAGTSPLTLDVSVQTAEQVRSIYAEIRDIEGLTLLF